jgi:hypothetical protein
VRFLGVVGAGVREEGQFELLGKLKRERSSSVKRATKELSQFVMVHGEIWVVSLPILPTTGSGWIDKQEACRDVVVKLDSFTSRR